MFEFRPPIYLLKKTAEKGQLYSITDETAQHPVGSVFISDEGAGERKTYVYAENADTSAKTAKTLAMLVPSYSLSGVTVHVDDLADAATYRYICAPEVSIPGSYYGWFQVQGEVDDVVTSDTDVHATLWTAGQALLMANAAVTTAAASDTGYADTVFGFAASARSASTTATGDIVLIGRESLGT